jgi:hypothetical protein
MSEPGKRGSRAVTAVNGAVAIGVVVVLAAVALVVKPPAPPGVSEFAPQAAKPISKAPPGQSSQFGNGAGACQVGLTCTGPQSTRAPLPAATHPVKGVEGVPSALQCYTWPDGSVTQTFDPQSPPCVASWPEAEKGNGGATSQGVTSGSIRIAVPVRGSVASARGIQPLIDFFNSQFQFYGRRMVLVPFVTSGYGRDLSSQRADGAQLASLRVFGSLDYAWTEFRLKDISTYLDLAAKAHVVTVSAGRQLQPSDLLDERAPYLWSYGQPMDVRERALGNVICRQLAGKPARHSSEFAVTPRKFGVLVPSPRVLGGNTSPDVADLKAALGRCGIHPEVATYNSTNQDANDTSLAQQMVAWKGDGVTSVIFVSAGTGDATMRTASQVGYHPEWLTLGSHMDDAEVNWSQEPPDQLRSLFGLGAWDRHVNEADEPVSRAYASQGPGSTPGGLGLWYTQPIYHELLLLASGIQAAGANLTPTTFESGLQALPFPNPGGGAAPYYQAHVGFGTSHVMVVDDALVWWNPAIRGQNACAGGCPDPQGGFCYVDHAARWHPEAFPDADRFFDLAESAC